MSSLDQYIRGPQNAWHVVSEQLYLNDILTREAVGTGLSSPALLVPGVIRPVIQQWANRFLIDVTPSGSYAKGTANRSGTDLDLFISLSLDTPETLADVHKTLVASLKAAGYQPRLQNVSIGITIYGHSVDLVPGKRQNWLFPDHSLYRRRGDTWTKTDINQHIEKVRNSGRQQEVRLIKL
jgi:tRNA nucleotidyltransferase (CCA-adding enzyme)